MADEGLLNGVEQGNAAVAGVVEGQNIESQSSWTSSLPDELKNDPAILKFNSIDALAKSYKHLEKNIGGNKINIPDQHATAEDWAEVFKKLGNPDKLEEYSVTPPEGGLLDEEVINSFRELAHKNGILPRQAQEILNWYNGVLTEQNSQMQINTQTQISEATETLKNEWGVGFEGKVAQARAAVKEFGGQELLDVLNQSGLGNNVQVIKAFANIGNKILEDKALPGQQARAQTTDDLISKARQMMGDPNHPYNQKSHPNHMAARSEVEKLYQLAYPEES